MNVTGVGLGGLEHLNKLQEESYVGSYRRFHDDVFKNGKWNVVLQVLDVLIYKELYLAIKTQVCMFVL